MTEKQIKDTATGYFKEGAIPKAFVMLEQLGPQGFCMYLFKKNAWITEGPEADYFWQSYLVNSTYFDEIMSGEEAINLLHHYFSIYTKTNPALLHKLAGRYPQLLITTIRVNRAFLNSHAPSLAFLEDHQDLYLKYHYHFFYKLGQAQKGLYNELQTFVAGLATVELCEVLHGTALWFEEKRASDMREALQGNRTDILHHATESIHLFLGCYFSIHRDKLAAEDLSYETILESQERVLSKCLEMQKAEGFCEQPVWKCLDAADEYWHFTSNVLYTYCFDLNNDVSREGEELVMKPVSLAKYQDWHVQGDKLAYWYAFNRVSAEAIVDYYMAKGMLVFQGHQESAIDIESHIRLQQAGMVAAQFGLHHSSVGDVTVEQLARIMNAFNSNALARLTYPVDLLNEAAPDQWLLHVNQVLGQGRAASLLRVMPSAEFDDLLEKEGENTFTAEAIQSIKDLLSTDVSLLREDERFKPDIQLVGKPFLYVNGWYLAFQGILGDTEIMSQVLINLLDKNSKPWDAVQKEETKIMEKELAELFKEAGFNHALYGKTYEERKKKQEPVKGDFDIVVYDAGVLLCIELKRGKIRTLLDEIWDEYRLSLDKASRQLERAEGYFRRNFGNLKEGLFQELEIEEEQVSELECYSLIVSTSFEYDHELIRGKHLKISLFELRELLQKLIDERRSCSLKELITGISRDLFWKEKLVASKERSLESTTYRIPFDKPE